MGVQGLPGLQSEFKSSLGRLIRSCFKLNGRKRIGFCSVIEDFPTTMCEALGSMFITERMFLGNKEMEKQDRRMKEIK